MIEEEKRIKLVNAEFLKPRASCEIPILTCTIYVLLSAMKKKYRKLLSCKKAENRQEYSRKRVFFKKKAFPGDTEVYEKKIIIYLKTMRKIEPSW